MKIKCYRFECSQCGVLSSIQVFYRKNNTISYCRARHKNAQGFYYHPMPKEYAEQKLRELNIDLGQASKTDNIDPNNPELSSKMNRAGPMGFEPMTFSLEG